MFDENVKCHDILCITNRTLCKGDFLTRVEKLAAAHPAGVILREKDLSESAYQALAAEALKVCDRYGTRCILHSFVNAARALECRSIHLPLHRLRTISAEDRAWFQMLGASCHSTGEAKEAEALGCTYITAGHIFDTDCKRGLPGRGLAFLEEVCKTVSIPVYAIGGISEKNIAQVRNAGAKGACVMSGCMNCEDPVQYLAAFYEPERSFL